MITKPLIPDTTTCRDVRILFDAVIDKYTISRTQFSSNAKIVHNPLFESAIVKIQDDAVKILPSKEIEAVNSLAITSEEGRTDGTDDFSSSSVECPSKDANYTSVARETSIWTSVFSTLKYVSTFLF